jgi:FMN phosphatase YigB (HAD superfamily)
MRFAELDAVTVDAFGTLVELIDPVPALGAALAARGTKRREEQIREAFAAEGRYYRAHIHEGADEEGLRDLHACCAGVFLEALGAELDPEGFAPDYVGCLHFRMIDGVSPALEVLRSRGLALAVVGNWDLTMHRWLDELGVASYFSVILHASRKPDPAGLQRALSELSVPPERALHIGDEPADAQAAAAAGMHYLPAPFADAVARIA